MADPSARPQPQSSTRRLLSAAAAHEYRAARCATIRSACTTSGSRWSGTSPANRAALGSTAVTLLAGCSALAAPEDARPVDLLHRLGDVVGGAVVVDRLFATGDGAIVVHDGIAADRQLGIERLARLH